MKDDKRERIKTAAAECLARFGYEKTTMEDIARRVGLNKTSLYYYFENKEAIFIEVVIEEAQLFIGALQAKIESVSGCRRRILTYLSERLRYYRKVVNLHNLSLDTLNRVQPRFKALYQSVLERETAFIKHILEQGMQSGEIRDSHPGRLAHAIMTVADALKHTACCQTDAPWPAEIDYRAIDSDLNLIVGLIMDGMAHRDAPPQT
ncbi:MAG: TetR/AcrR family transcriptional regulator [Desulfobacterales bacterium]|nr:TetR/AcrR family transcriptional regulator [Desulfobacterales bacterium]